MQFEEFVTREIDALTRFAGVLTGDRQVAHDVLADALIKAGRHWSKIESIEYPVAYVRTIVVTTYLADKRKTLRRRTVLASTATQESDLLSTTQHVEDLDKNLTVYSASYRASNGLPSSSSTTSTTRMTRSRPH